VSTDLRIEVVVDIGENVDHHCVLFSFIKLDNGIFEPIILNGVVHVSLSLMNCSYRVYFNI
jgi:hypothetical protein